MNPVEEAMQTLKIRAKAKGKTPFAGKEKGVRKPAVPGKKLPVPPPTPAQQAASAASVPLTKLGETPEGKANAATWVFPKAARKPQEPKEASKATQAAPAHEKPPAGNSGPTAAERTAIDVALLKAQGRTAEAALASLDLPPTEDPKKDGIPASLQVQNRQPLSPEQQAKVDAAAAKAKTKAGSEAHQAELRAAQKATKKAAAKARAEDRKAKKARREAPVIASAPLEGKAALSAIRGKEGPKGRQSPGYQRLLKSGKAEPLRKETAAMQKKATAVKPSGESKTEIALRMLKKGATRKAIAEAVNWPSINLKPIAKRYGLKLTQKNGVFFAV